MIIVGMVNSFGIATVTWFHVAGASLFMTTESTNFKVHDNYLMICHMESFYVHTQLRTLPEICGYPIVGLAKIFHNSFNWMCTFSMGLNKNEKLPNFRSSRLL